MTLALVIVSSVFSYLVIAGLAIKLVSLYFKADPTDNPGPFMAGLVWPLSLPLLLGAFLVGWNQKRAARRRLPKAHTVSSGK